MKNKIMQSVIEDKFYFNYCRKMCKYDNCHEDLYQYIILQLLEMDEEKIVQIHKGSLKQYIIRMIFLSANSKTSPFYKQYYNLESEEISDTVLEIKEDNVESFVEVFDSSIINCLNKEEQEFKNRGEYPWTVMLFKVWQNEGSYLKTAKKTKIPYPTVRYHITNLIKKMNENINHN